MIKKTLLLIWASVAWLAGALLMIANLALPFRFADCLLPLMLFASCAAALLLFRARSHKLLLGWAIGASALFAAANVAAVAADGSPVLLYYGRMLWCSVPALMTVLLSWVLVWIKKRPLRGFRRVLPWLAGVVLLAYAGWAAGSLVYVQRTATVEETDVPVPAFELDAAKLDAFLRDRYGEDCEALPLTGVRLNAEINGGAATGHIYLEYGRYVDARRDGGNVEAVCFCVDIASGRVVSIERYRGARLTRPMDFDAVAEATLQFPYPWYIEHAAELAKTPETEPLRLHCDSDAAGTAVRILTKTPAGVCLYEDFAPG